MNAQSIQIAIAQITTERLQAAGISARLWIADKTADVRIYLSGHYLAEDGDHIDVLTDGRRFVVVGHRAAKRPVTETLAAHAPRAEVLEAAEQQVAS